jgi:hypothetical protein
MGAFSFYVAQQQKDVAAPENEEDNNPENGENRLFILKLKLIFFLENKSQSSTISSKGEGKKDKGKKSKD